MSKTPHPRFSSVTETALFSIRCGSCRKTFQEAASRLIEIDRIACPLCGGIVDLKRGYNGLRLKELLDNCARIDTALRQAGER